MPASPKVSSAPLTLASPIASLRSVGARAAGRLARLGISTVRHLLWHLPSRYEDYSQVTPIAQVSPGQKQSIRGHVVAIATRFIWPRRMSITTATVQDDSGAIRAVWFNQPYLQEALPEGTLVSLAGKVVLDRRGLYISGPVHEKPDAAADAQNLRHTGRLVPVYPETEGVTSKFLRYLIAPLLESLEVADPLPQPLRQGHDLLPLDEALRRAHYPARAEDADAARARLAFDDVFLIQLKALAERRLANLRKSPAVPMDAAYMRELIAELPWPLTRDQRVAALEILRDMERPYPMNRLLEGDVGSGKTVVAYLAALHAGRAGWQSAVLAPTDVLARQHYRTLRSMAPDASAALLTASAAMLGDREVPKARVKKAIAVGQVTVAVGTHALLQDDVTFRKLALAVVDEQHRFGTAQRARLLRTRGAAPHLLSMTATPIPRTLALTVFGDLDISLLREKPAGRLPIRTEVIGPDGRAAMERFIRDQIRSGRQAFVICPVIERTGAESGRAASQRRLQLAEAKAVTEEYDRLRQKVFPDLKLAMLHGRMKAAEKERIMREFKEGWHDILVSTTVVEVGVDVPNASIMLVEGADRFGLAQLHQLRGRVGRSGHASYCFLASSDGGSTARLRTLEKTDDGFKLAEADLKLRGPGQFFGVRQSGMSDLAMAALADPETVKKARLAARTVMKADPELKRHPLLREQLDAFRNLVHSE